MTITLKLIKPESSDCKLHSIPCKIHADNSAKVSLYFKPNVGDDGFLSSSFRGYPLDGKEVKVPEKYCGLVFEEVSETNIEGEERNLRLKKTFNSLTYWNWNRLPTKSDPFISALDWLDVSQAVHDPVEEE